MTGWGRSGEARGSSSSVALPPQDAATPSSSSTSATSSPEPDAPSAVEARGISNLVVRGDPGVAASCGGSVCEKRTAGALPYPLSFDPRRPRTLGRRSSVAVELIAIISLYGDLPDANT